MKHKGELANKALFVVMRSCSGPMSQVIGHYLAKVQLPGDVLAKVLVDAIVAVRNAGFTVIGTTCDAGMNQWPLIKSRLRIHSKATHVRRLMNFRNQ